MSDSSFQLYLSKLGETKIDFAFDRSIQLSKLTHKKLPSVIVCGTNGKGSTCLFLESILRESGYRVGTNLSPHIEKVNERIRINGEPIRDDDLEKFGSQFREKLQQAKIQPTYFEFLTFLAMEVFESLALDIGIFETGLGGRLDSTNAIARQGAILTKISMDHMEYLGNTLRKIALEKLPILQKSPISVVTRQDDEVLKTLQEQDFPYILEGEHYTHSGNEEMFIFDTTDFSVGPIKLGTRGDHQASNAASAIMMAKLLKEKGWKKITEATCKAGVQKTTIEGRLEKWGHQNSSVWLDVAHNPGAIEKLCQYFYVRGEKEFETLFGTSKEKPYKEMIEKLVPITKNFHFVSTPRPRGWNPDFELQDPSICIQKVLDSSKNQILCTGSFYFLADIRKKLAQLGFRKIV